MRVVAKIHSSGYFYDCWYTCEYSDIRVAPAEIWAFGNGFLCEKAVLPIFHIKIYCRGTISESRSYIYTWYSPRKSRADISTRKRDRTGKENGDRPEIAERISGRLVIYGCTGATGRLNHQEILLAAKFVQDVPCTDVFSTSTCVECCKYHESQRPYFRRYEIFPCSEDSRCV